MRYSDLVADFCGSDWESKESERNGGIGVACVRAYLAGVEPDTEQMARHLGLQKEDVDVPLRRLIVNRVFSADFNLRFDPLMKTGEDSFNLFLEKRRTAIDPAESKGIYVFDSAFSSLDDEYQHSIYNAWCIVAGIAGGFTGLRES